MRLIIILNMNSSTDYIMNYILLRFTLSGLSWVGLACTKEFMEFHLIQI